VDGCVKYHLHKDQLSLKSVPLEMDTRRVRDTMVSHCTEHMIQVRTSTTVTRYYCLPAAGER